MDGNISEMLKSVLDDPGAMKKLMGVAENLMGSGGAQEKPDCPPPSRGSRLLRRSVRIFRRSGGRRRTDL